MHNSMRTVFQERQHQYIIISFHTCPQPPLLPAAAGLSQCSRRPPVVSPPAAAARCGRRSDACPLQCTPQGWSGDMLSPRSANLSTVVGGGWVMGEVKKKKNGETNQNITIKMTWRENIGKIVRENDNDIKWVRVERWSKCEEVKKMWNRKEKENETNVSRENEQNNKSSKLGFKSPIQPEGQTSTNQPSPEHWFLGADVHWRDVGAGNVCVHICVCAYICCGEEFTV